MNKLTMLAGTAALAMSAGAATAQKAGEGKADYWISAETTSGMGAMAGANPRALAGAMMGGHGMGGGTAKNLTLQLGSTGKAPGAPSAEHLPPQGLQAGASLPLVTPQGVRAPAAPQSWDRNMERPKGRILIYWGCGEHARAGQPAVIDFATMTAGKMPPAFAAAAFRAMNPPSPAGFATYGEWPNERNGTRVPAGASLVGAHVVRGNYTPEIHFNLAPGQDFLAPVALTSQNAAPSGSIPLVWRPVSGARGWLATTMGAGQNGDMVFWSSSEAQAMMMAADYLGDAEIARLVQQKVLLPGTADRCTVPAEVARAVEGGMLSLTAFGGETNLSSPARPARAPASWRPDWSVKLRTRSTYMGMLGMDMNDMMGANDDDSGRPANQPGQKPKKKKKSLFGEALGGIIGQ